MGMTNEEKILEMLSAIQKDITAIKEDVEELKEGQEETRSGVNALLEWAEECGNVIKFPLPKVK
jgi:queuine/archaeosine tRNA-ribosyltransferase